MSVYKNGNTGNRNTGNHNTGNHNTGNRNTGDLNAGNLNTGNRNEGNGNTGDCNAGYWNAGNRNAGYLNTGNRNIGDGNAGDCNTGNRNTGDWNAGDLNAGNWNTGDYNAGDWNNCDNETGFFNTEQSNEIRVFNSIIQKSKWDSYDKPEFLYFKLTCWITQNNMTEEEKKDNPTYKDIGGYLKEYGYKEAFKKSWDNANKEDRKKILDCPNFDNDIFFEISGIDVNKELQSKKVTIELTEDQLDKIKHLL